MYVRAKYRRKGIAQKLLNKAINKAKLLNAQKYGINDMEF
ncbi:GNAT family N-acetyltransferase [Fusobacterium polymorphum]